MKREYELKRRLRSLSMRGEAVSAMTSLSAHHFREARGAVPTARRYRQGVEEILRLTGASLPAWVPSVSWSSAESWDCAAGTTRSLPQLAGSAAKSSGQGPRAASGIGSV